MQCFLGPEISLGTSWSLLQQTDPVRSAPSDNLFLVQISDASQSLAGDLDAAVLDRMDEVVEFPIPGPEERLRLFKLYLQKYILAAGTDEGGAGSERRHGLLYAAKYFLSGRKVQVEPIRVTDLTDEDLIEMATKCEGFSAREIAKTMAAVQSAAYGTPDATLSSDLFRQVVERRISDHANRVRMEAGELNQV